MDDTILHRERRGTAMDVDVVDDKFGSSDIERTLELQMFREKWKEELDRDKENVVGSEVANQEPVASTSAPMAETASRSKFEIAAEIFREGIKEERSGRLYEAVRLYRRAIQLDPDIEFKFEKSVDLKKKTKNRTAGENPDAVVEEVSVEELLENLMEYDVYGKGICQADDAALPTNTHFSALPCEIVQYLTQWIVSSELDMLSLEQFALVCRGFYRIARDDVIWRMACFRIWGVLSGRPEDHHYGSWREMLVMRPQVRFNGVYISRISYVRPGESSFIDHESSQYQAWYSVHYYRFFRFFADGTVFYSNTPDEPLVLVPRLRNSQTAQNKDQQHAHILFGHYTLSPDGSGVVVFLKRDVFRNDQTQRNNPKNKRGKKLEGYETLTMELVIRDTRERLHARLDWRRYTITRTIGKKETESVVDVNQHFPSCFFSRVKSYLAHAESPLLQQG